MAGESIWTSSGVWKHSMGQLLECRAHFMFGGVPEPLPPHLMYDVLPSDLSLTNHSPKLSQRHNPLGFLFSICLFHADTVPGISTNEL
jgi:hypothetical protein